MAMSISFDRLSGLRALGVNGVGVFSMLVDVAGIMLGLCGVSWLIVAMAVFRALRVTNRIGQYSAAEPDISNSNVCWRAAVSCNGSVTPFSCLLYFCLVLLYPPISPPVWHGWQVVLGRVFCGCRATFSLW